MLFGESLGAWTSQDPFVDQGTQGLVDAGIDHAIWIGTPHFSKWKEQVLYDDRPDVDPSMRRVFNNIDEWSALDPSERGRIRFVMITHHDDGVALFGPELAIQAPSWLGPPRGRPAARCRKGMRWMPTVAFFQVLVDMKNSATVVPGKFAAKGHDYRADLLPFFHRTLGFEASDEQLDGITALPRVRGAPPQPMDRGARDRPARASPPRSLERLLEEQRAQGHDTDSRLVQIVRELAAENLGAGGGASTAERVHPPGDER